MRRKLCAIAVSLLAPSWTVSAQTSTKKDVPPGKGELLPYPMAPGSDLFTAGIEDLQ
jgi:hypothetical protein